MNILSARAAICSNSVAHETNACQQNSSLILKSSKGEIEDKMEALKKAEEHLQATTERSFYNAKIQDCRRVLADNNIMELRKPGNDVLNSSSDFEVFFNPLQLPS